MTKGSINKKKILRSWGILGFIVLTVFGLLTFFPSKQDAVLTATKSYLAEMIFILPAVMILIGLFKEWVPEDVIVEYMGEQSGVKGVSTALILGSTPTGPLYVAFPIASELLEKEASVTNIVIFLTAWACLKLPQEIVEIQFLGGAFTALRLVLTAAAAIVMGLIMEYLLFTKYSVQNQK